MKIELFTELSYENQNPQEIIDIDINENSSIGELLSKIHEVTNIPSYTELRWDDNIEKIASRYFYKSGTKFDDYTIITDLEKQIDSLPKYGYTGELLLYINNDHGLVN